MAGGSKNKLTDAHRAFVVQRIACFDSPKEVADALKAEHGVDITPQAVENYDPGKKAGQTMAKRWRELHASTRKAFLDDVSLHIPEANKSVRIRELSKAARALKARGNYIGMADMLERVAKELGDVHTNRRELTGKGGGPIAFNELSNDQLDARLAKLMQALGVSEE
jgi:hypothetical protein